MSMFVPSFEAYIKAARRLYADHSNDDDLEIDENPEVSPCVDDSGAWVQAWVWVRDEDTYD